jgi:hypothetical protein
LFPTTEAGLIAKAELKLSNINKLLRFFLFETNQIKYTGMKVLA